MADFFGKLKQTIDKSAKVITAKSSSAIDLTKIKSEISTLKKSKNETLFVIGKKVYESDRSTFSFDVINQELEKAANLDLEISKKEADMERIKAETEEKLDQINKSYADEPESVKFEDVAEDASEDAIDFENIDDPKND